MNPILHIPDLTADDMPIREVPAPRKRAPRGPYKPRKHPPKVNVTFRCDRDLYEAFRANDPNWAETLRKFVKKKAKA